ncbi:MAG: DUF2118 domain-containing protein [Rhizobiaceae bacterium]|nr:DUF2118 domain-containing protein [Rhizobiaceae bacterium]
MIRKLLIANRGEIACRIIRTADRMGIATVAVYSDADTGAAHVRMAGEAMRVGAAAPAESYLNIAAIVAAALASGADAVHPGYGFLAENADFAEAVIAAGLTFVGPPAQAIRTMGDKPRAKAIAESVGVPTLRGYGGENQTEARFMLEARVVGFPLLVKSAAGGGGRGMRAVGRQEDLPAALESARREAESAFGDGSLLIERFVGDGRHIEVQVFADTHGNRVHLGERDCSAQRRHQKVIEESPSPFVDVALRSRLGVDAVTLAKAVGYVGAGTVEFIVEADGRHYFLEMNTRLQVEHPVTEMVTGIDLVEWQLRVASGEPLPRRQVEIPFQGHAIEARLYAEDPYSGFAPQTGRVAYWRAEHEPSPYLRIDSGVEEGDGISPFYDPLVAKIIAHGATREAARGTLVAALRDSPLFGVVTNRGFLIDLLKSQEFRDGEMTTKTLDRWRADRHSIFERPAPPAALWARAAAAFGRIAEGDWFRSTGVAECPVTVECGAETRDVVFRFERGKLTAVRVVGEVGTSLPAPSDEFGMEVDGAIWIEVGGHIFVLAEPDPFRRKVRADDGSKVLSPVSGLVRAVGVAVGDSVEGGQPVAVIEAMKMETRLVARVRGRVVAVHVAAGRQAKAGDVLVEIAPERQDAPTSVEAPSPVVQPQRDVVKPNPAAPEDPDQDGADPVKPERAEPEQAGPQPAASGPAGVHEAGPQ